jgi:hypothetical protein
LLKIDGTDYNTQWTTIPLLTTANTFTGGVQQITTASAATKGLIIRGTASQTANLFEAQDSSGNLLHNLSPTQLVLTNSTAAAGDRGLLIRQSFASIGGATGTFQKSRGSSTSPTVVVSGDIIGAMAFSSYNGSAYTSDTTLIGASVSGVSGSNISQSVFITTGTSPTGNYNPNLLVHHSGGVGIGGSFGSIIGTLTAPTAALQVNSIATGTPVLIARGAASQTANLQEWQNSGGTVLAKVSSTGAGTFTGIASTSTNDLAGTTYMAGIAARSDFGSAILTFQSGRVLAITAATTLTSQAAASVGLIVKGAASQTANLQQWQNSAGTVLAKIDSAGNLVFTQAGANITTPASGRLNIGGAVYGSTAFGTISVIGDNGGYAIDARGNAASGSTGGRVRPGNAANVGLIIAGESSQTADLQSWRSSTALLTSITAAGTINFQSGNTSATANTGAVALPALAVGFITMQVAGTTVKVPYYAN